MAEQLRKRPEPVAIALHRRQLLTDPEGKCDVIIKAAATISGHLANHTFPVAFPDFDVLI